MGFEISGFLHGVTETLQAMYQKAGYEPVYSAVERHGLLEWRAVKKQPTVPEGTTEPFRYLVLQIEIDLASPEPHCDLRLSVGIDNSSGYCRRILERRRVPSWETSHELQSLERRWVQSATALNDNHIDALYSSPRVWDKDITAGATTLTD
ncbi:hypothetical protein [Amycolatopsis sp. MJM2582]|uniref:hypothetical protein n=1 Tax=Amycolatopsis sp. MJM2582 TaxID=1427749 RepID=UPI001269E267|nr:hypothetical protein [Amycolatopsis sp. MJM2582]